MASASIQRHWPMPTMSTTRDVCNVSRTLDAFNLKQRRSMEPEMANEILLLVIVIASCFGVEAVYGWWDQRKRDRQWRRAMKRLRDADDGTGSTSRL